MHVAVTPSETESGLPRPVDDWQPRANITKLFNNGKVSLNNQDEITKFSVTFYVKREYVVTCIEHLTNLKLTKQIRQEQEKQTKTKEKKRSMKSTIGSTLYCKANSIN